MAIPINIHRFKSCGKMECTAIEEKNNNHQPERTCANGNMIVKWIWIWCKSERIYLERVAMCGNTFMWKLRLFHLNVCMCVRRSSYTTLYTVQWTRKWSSHIKTFPVLLNLRSVVFFAQNMVCIWFLIWKIPIDKFRNCFFSLSSVCLQFI